MNQITSSISSNTRMHLPRLASVAGNFGAMQSFLVAAPLLRRLGGARTDPKPCRSAMITQCSTAPGGEEARPVGMRQLTTIAGQNQNGFAALMAANPKTQVRNHASNLALFDRR